MGSVTKDRAWVYTGSVKGRFQRLHRISGVVLQAILFVTPWITVGEHPAFLLDLAGRRLFALGAIFTPRDTLFLVLIGLFAAFSLFLFTSLAGRLWCGFACPQTVFLEEWIRPIESAIEGERGKRISRDKGPWVWDKTWRKALKWTIFALVAVVVAMTLMSWFSPARALWTGEASLVTYALTGILSAVLFADFAWFREQFCNYLCPYARFQGALTDDESQVLAYNVTLGEPGRGTKAAASTGACINCNKCVAVCPQGIDIREGYQLECIACARCVDACEGVMAKLEHEPLIRYTTVTTDLGQKPRLLRPRTVAYGAILSLVATVFLVKMNGRHDLEVAVNRAPGTLFTVDADGWVRNTYLLEVHNNHGISGQTPLTVSVMGIAGAEIIVPPLVLDSNETLRVPLVVRVPPDAELSRTSPLEVHVTASFDAVVVQTTFKNHTPEG